MELNLSKHAAKRMSQRGIRHIDIQLLIAYSDLVLPRGNHSSSYTMTERAYRDMLESDVPIQVADRIRNMCAIVSWDGEVVSVMKLFGSRGKRYRREGQIARRKRNATGEKKWVM